MDVHSKEVRSYNMSKVKSKNTQSEEIVRKFLFSKGFRYRKNVKTLPGSPDIVLPKYKKVIFVNGCFWHVHEDCKLFSWPSTNIDFWKNKLMTNVERDKQNTKLLNEMGWKVIVVWGCELKNNVRKDRLNLLVHQIIND